MREQRIKIEEEQNIMDKDFQFYTVVNNLSAVEHLPKGRWERFLDWFKARFYGKEKQSGANRK